MRLLPARRVARAAALALVAGAVSVTGASTASAATVHPVAHVFWDATEENGVALKMGSKGRVLAWSVASECGDVFEGGRATFKRSKVTLKAKSKHGRATVRLRVVGKRLILGHAEVKVSGEPDCSGTRPMIAGDGASWKTSGDAYAVATLADYTVRLRSAADAYGERTGEVPASKRALLKVGERADVRPSRKYGETVRSYKPTSNGRSFVLRTTGKRVDVGIQLRRSTGTWTWLY